MYFDSFIDNACKSINNNHCSIEKSVSFFLPFKKTLSSNKKEFIVVDVKKEPFSCKVAGVDSGFVSKKISVADLILIKLGGVIFEFNNSVLTKADYFPSPVMLPEPILLKSFLEKDEELQSISLERLRKEIMLARDIIKKYSPKYLFLDGSIVPQYQDKPRDDSQINSDYRSIIDLFQELYSIAEEKNCVLISTIEDSRGKRFVQLLDEISSSENLFDSNNLNNSSLLANVSDSFFLDSFLTMGERTFCFKYTANYLQHPILKDYNKEWAENIFVFYLKASNLDFPIRVEFITKKNCFDLANEIASIVYSLSSIHKEYSFPSILIEADLRARLNDEDISIIYNKLIDKLGPKLKLRRNARPFK